MYFDIYNHVYAVFNNHKNTSDYAMVIKNICDYMY